MHAVDFNNHIRKTVSDTMKLKVGKKEEICVKCPLPTCNGDCKRFDEEKKKLNESK